MPAITLGRHHRVALAAERYVDARQRYDDAASALLAAHMGTPRDRLAAARAEHLATHRAVREAWARLSEEAALVRGEIGRNPEGDK